MPDFRYPQLCALARAAEVLGERWTLLILRDLFSGPLRFGDLQARLGGTSPSVLSERMAQLEERGLVERATLAPPAHSPVYALTESGRALEPALLELTRWGVRFLTPDDLTQPLEPSWAVMGLRASARGSGSPRASVHVRVPDAGRDHVFRVRGGPRGTRISTPASGRGGRCDLEIRVEARALLMWVAGFRKASDLLDSGDLEAQGDLSLLDDFPNLFDVQLGPGGAPETKTT